MAKKETKNKKKKKELKPEIKDNTKYYDESSMKFIADNLDKASITLEEDKTESFLQTLVKSLNDRKNITMKTEYISIRENFAGTKLEFLAKYGNMPYLDGFLDMFEVRRVSLHRKGRQEDIMLAQESKRQEEEDRMAELSQKLGVGTG